MKIGVYLDKYSPQDGGAHTFQSELVEALSGLAGDSEHEFVLLIPKKSKRLDNKTNVSLGRFYYRKANFIEKTIALLARNWPNFRQFIQWRDVVEKQFRKEKIEFIWFLSARPKDFDIPFMAIVWDLQHRVQPWFPEVSQWGQWEIRERGIQPFLSRASAIIAGTQAGKDEITSFYRVPEERVHLLPHPTPSFALDTQDTDLKDIRKKFELPEKFLFYPAQFWAHKNHIGILKAIKLLKEEHKLEMSAVFVGADFGNKQFVIDKAEEWGLSERIHFLGFVEQKDLAALYQAAFALAYYSSFGPENLPPLEAMALGTPVIAAIVAGSEEQFADAAMLVDPYKPEELAASVNKLDKNQKLRERLIELGKARAAKWTAKDFVGGAIAIMDQFSGVRGLWGHSDRG